MQRFRERLATTHGVIMDPWTPEPLTLGGDANFPKNRLPVAYMAPSTSEDDDDEIDGGSP
jgi:hypothetical protein